MQTEVTREGAGVAILAQVEQRQIDGQWIANV